MKTCRFILGKGKNTRTFNSELELEEFLLLNKKYYEKYGDIVFSLTSQQNSVRHILLESDSKKNKLYKINREAQVTGFSEDYYHVEKPYIGVNEFLRNYRRQTLGKEDTPLSPVFDIDNFIINKSKDWKRQEYWDNEATEEEIRDIFGEQDPHILTTAQEYEAAKQRLQKKWAHQSYVGTALHNAMSIWWKAPNDVKQSPEAFENYLRTQLVGKVGTSPKTYEELIPDFAWKQISVHCYNINKELNERFPGATFLTEIGITSDITDDEGKVIPLVGVADLLVVDKLGNIQVIDYKTSPKSYDKYNDAKKRSFYYQLAVYRRMIQRLGIRLNEDSRAYVIPFKFENFRYNQESDSSTFDSLQAESYNPSTGNNDYSYLEELPILSGNEADTINTEINNFLPPMRFNDVRQEDVINETNDFIKECFPSFSAEKELTDEYVIERIKRQNGFKKDPNTNKYYYKIGKDIIQNDDDLKLVESVKKVLQEYNSITLEDTQGFKSVLKKAQKEGVLDFGYYHTTMKEHASEIWLEERFGKYANENWEVIDNYPALDELGIILVQHRFTKQIDQIILSKQGWNHLDDPVLLGGATKNDIKNNNKTLITGNFEPDIVQKQKPKQMALTSTFGNIELMKGMAVLNMFPNLISDNNGIIGEVMVVSTRDNQGMTASPNQLMYNFKELQRLRNKRRAKEGKEVVVDHFNNKNIKMMSFVELAKNKFKTILAEENINETTKNVFWKWKNFKNTASELDKIGENPLRLRSALLDIAIDLEKQFPNLKRADFSKYNDAVEPERQLYYWIHMAIAEIDGVNYTQQVTDHDKFLEKRNILKHGVSGTMYDNPGNMSSSTLNFISQQVNVAYQNLRNDMVKLNEELRNKVNKLKQTKEFGYIKSRTFGNQANLYSNMYYEFNGDLYFKDPWDPNSELTDDEREFLMFAIKVINGDRFNCKTEEDFKNAQENDYYGFFSVPLAEGTTQSKISVKGLLNTTKGILRSYSPKHYIETLKRKIDGYLTEDESVKSAKRGERWEMLNMFSASNDFNSRKKLIAKVTTDHPDLGLAFFERNLETLLLKHRFAYSQKEHIDKVFPTIKAGMLHLSMQGVIMNDKFEEDIQYLSDFIKAKIFNLSIQDEKWDPIVYPIKLIMSGASKLALAFNPRQLYQALDGLWKDISLIIRKPDGEYSFTAKNLKDAFFWIYNDLRHFGNNKSMGELLNETYGLNDMDINTLTQRIGSDNVGIWNFWDVGFRMASRPDYYNRMTIFSAQMRGDGCFDAHKVVNGHLIYDWTADKRFDLFAVTDESEVKNLSPEQQAKYNRQKAEYIAMAKQFMAEHAVDKDGNEFVLDLEKKIPLPRAYTIQQSESMKSLSDLLYGYYSHEKKSLIQSTTFGALVMQMNTYWSSKKNQWLAPGGVKMQGRMEQYEEDGVKYWYKLNENGELTNEITDDDASGVPYMQWKGQYQEGIFVTMANIFTDWWNDDQEHGLSGLYNVAKNKYWQNSDENLRRAYRDNLWNAFIHLIMALIMGSLVVPALQNATNDYIKNRGNNSLEDAIVNNCLLNSVEILNSSLNDFDAIDSIFGRGVQWTPFAISTMQRLAKQVGKVVTGSTDFYDFAVNMAAATRTQEPIWDFIKISTLGRKIGDNGKEE